MRSRRRQKAPASPSVNYARQEYSATFLAKRPKVPLARTSAHPAHLVIALAKQTSVPLVRASAHPANLGIVLTKRTKPPLANDAQQGNMDIVTEFLGRDGVDVNATTGSHHAYTFSMQVRITESNKMLIHY